MYSIGGGLPWRLSSGIPESSLFMNRFICRSKGQIIAGTLQPGEALPSIRHLAKDLRISVITTKRAYDELEKEGFLNTVAGKGCFVSEKKYRAHTGSQSEGNRKSYGTNPLSGRYLRAEQRRSAGNVPLFYEGGMNGVRIGADKCEQGLSGLSAAGFDTKAAFRLHYGIGG